MSDQKRPNEPDKNDKKNGELRLPPRTFLVWIGIIAVVSILMLVRNGSETPVEELGSFHDLLDKLTNSPSLIVPGSGRIVYGLQSPDIKRITGKYYAMDHGKKVEVAFKLETPLTEKKTDLLIDSGEFKAVNNNNLMLSVFLNTFLPFFLILGALYFFIFRQIKMAGKGAMSFGKSRARMMNKEKNKITFKDVAGVEEAKEEVSELVEFLNRRMPSFGLKPIDIAAGQAAAATVILAPLALAFERPWALPIPSEAAIASVLAIAAFSTALAFIVYFRILAGAGATNVLLVTLLVPATAVLLGALFLNERLLPRQFLGFALIGLGLAFIDGRLPRALFARNNPKPARRNSRLPIGRKSR